MLTDLYIEALLTDEVLSDELWRLWNQGVIYNQLAIHAWWLIATCQNRTAKDYLVPAQYVGTSRPPISSRQ